MRKNFTQLFLGLALMVGFTTMSFAQCEIPPPPGSIYNFQFDGGLDGWRSLDAAGSDTDFGWTYSETGDISMGAYGPEVGTTIISESQCNGAMVMDSDFLDNNGVQGDFGLGDCPAVCNGYLVSPEMDLSAHPAVELLYTQAVRQFDSEFYIYVSIDGGLTNVDTIQINQSLVTNATLTNETVNIPLCAAGGNDKVVITFHYVGDYYFWALDDISVLEATTDVDMRVNNNFYSKIGNYAVPRNMTHTVPILADIENLKAFSNPASTLNFRARNSAGDVIFSSSRNYGEVPGCSTDENKLFDDQFAVPSEMGDYTIEFEMDAEGDVNPDNDLITAPFKVTGNEFRKLPTQEEFGSEYLSGVRYGGSFISWGAYFYIPQNDAEQAIESVSLGIITSAGETPNAGIINVGVYEWVDFDMNGEVNMNERILLGETDILVEPNSPEFLQWTVTPLDANGEKIVPAAGAEILVLAHTNPFNGVTNYFFNAVPDVGFEQFSNGATNLAHDQATLKGGSGSFASTDAASHDDRHTTREFFSVDGFYVFDVAMELTPLDVSTEEINEDLGVQIFPSPASTQVNIDLNLAELSKDVSIELMDVAGNKIGQYNYKNIKKDRLTLDVSELTGGMYLINVRTEAGMTSKKISVIH
ncbi:MAG: T9SS type A sorting domain-containing protein [Saprospiraceae bacterium]|nr:T9SS type A sorting domain-containing protein [Saprospiraceae bacterium]